MNLSELLDKAKWDRLSSAEIEWVRRQLADHPEAADEYTLLHIAGRGLLRPDPALVGPYLERSDDPMLARLALQILCNYWGLTERYLPVVRRFVEGVEWDDDSVRLVALSIAGRYLREHADPGLLDLLLEIAQPDPKSPEETLRAQVALEALAAAVGRPREELRPVSTGFDTDDEWSRGVRAEALDRLRRDMGL